MRSVSVCVCVCVPIPVYAHMCTGICVYVGIRVCENTCVRACRGQKSTSGVIFPHPLTLFFEVGCLTDLELPKWV